MRNPDELFHDFMDRIYEIDFNDNQQITRTITFQVTDDCCCACSYCYQINKKHNAMTPEMGKSIVDLIFKERQTEDGILVSKYTNGIILDFIGGEPLMNIETIDAVCSYFLDQCLKFNDPWINKWRISIISNGKHYFDPKVQNFIKKFNHFLSFNISIDGPKEIHDACRVYPDGSGNFDDAYKALKHYITTYNSYNPGTKVTISKDNLKNISQITKFFVEDLGITEINGNCIFEEEWTYADAKQFYYQLKEIADYMLSQPEDNIYFSRFAEHIGTPMLITENKNYCGGTGNTIAFDANGIAYPCLRYHPSSLGDDRKPLIVGSVKNGLYKTPEDLATEQKLKEITRRSQSTDECFYCVVAGGCAWCSAWNYQETGSPNKRSTRICPMHKANALANYYYWNQFYRKNNINKRMHVFLLKEEALKIIDEDEYNLLLNLSQLDESN